MIFANLEEKMKELKYGIIEVTRKCQLRCQGCFMVRSGVLSNNQMTLEQAVNVLDLCKEYRGGRELETMDILGGDPLLWPHLEMYIEELLSRGISPWIFTNMLAIKPEWAKWLHERGVYVTGKLNINPEDPGQWGIQAALIGRSERMAKKMVGAIQVFLDAGYKAPMFRLENLVRRANILQVPQYYRWCLERDIDPDVEVLGCGIPLSQEYWQIGPSPKELAQMVKGIQTVRWELGKPNFEVLMPHIFSRCRFFESGLYFAVDGHIRACSNSSLLLGYVTDEDPVKRAYESRLFKCRHSLVKEKIGAPCGECDRWERCKGGCRATAEGSGDPFSGDKLCPVPYL
ncbi:radical SAM/SPASM domain-containing protein [Pseudomonadota bacterium]